MKSALNKAKALHISYTPGTHESSPNVYQCQTTYPHEDSPELLSRTLYPGLQDPTHTDLSEVVKHSFIAKNNWRNPMTAGRMQKALPGLYILFITTEGDWHHSKVSQIGLEPWSYVVITPTGTTYWCNQWQLKALNYTSTVNTNPIPRLSTRAKCSALCVPVTHPY